MFHSKCKFVPIFSLNELELFESCSGYLAGTTNQLFLNFPKAKADLVINIDKDCLIIPAEKMQTPKLKLSRLHTMFEKMMMSELVS